MRETWLVPESQRLPTVKGYFPPDSRIKPVEFVLCHYTANYNGSRALYSRVRDWASDNRQSSTHILIARDPRKEPTLQMMPLEARSWHGGGKTSRWHGKTVNERSLGVDADNGGYLVKRGSAYFYPTQDDKGEPVFVSYHGPAPLTDTTGRLWEPYTDECVLEFCRVVLMLGDLHSHLRQQPDSLLGHQHVTPTKSDPGPAFPWEVIKRAWQGTFPTGLTQV